MKMKHFDILFTGYLHGFGGAEKSMIRAANALAERGFKVAILTFDVDSDKFGIDSRVSKYFIPINHKSGIKRYWEHIKKIKDFLGDVHADLVMHFWFMPSVFFQFFARRYKFKNYYSERGDPGDKEYGGVIGVIRNWILPQMDGFVFQTRGARDYFDQKIIMRSVVIPNPVYIKAEDYVLPTVRRKVIASVGRLSEQKNFRLLIDGFAKVADKYPDYVVHIYGEGDLRDELQAQIDSKGLHDRIILKGVTTKVFDCIVDCTVFILSSLFEGMPNALMEAMALGIPSVSVDCPPGGPAELVEIGKNGLLCKNNDADDLADKLDYMLTHPKEAEIMGRNAKNICYTHSTSVIFDKWSEFVEKELCK